MRARLRFREPSGGPSTRGAIVMVFPDSVRAEMAKQALILHGFSEESINRRGEQAAEISEKDEQQSKDPAEEAVKVDVYLDSSDERVDFLVVSAPVGAELQGALEIADHYGLTRAEKYNRLVLEQVA